MPRFGWISLQSLHVDGVRIGIYPHEQAGPQSVVVDVRLWVDFARAVRTEKIKDTVDYAAVAELVRELARARYYPLLEALAERLADAVLARFKARKVGIEVRKPGALAPGTVSIQIERHR